MNDKLNSQSSPTSSKQEELTSKPPKNSKLVSGKVEQAKEVKKKDVEEVGGPKGLEPTRYGDWESKGRCYDF